MEVRSQRDRRTDSLTAERFDLAVLAARAFDLHAGHSYLVLSGIPPHLARGFVTRYPGRLRMRLPAQPCERRGRITS